MNFTKRTYYLMGITCCALNFAAGALLIFNVTFGLLVNVASIGNAAMMLFLIPRVSEKSKKITGLLGSVFLIADFFSAAIPQPFSVIASLFGAVAFSVFALGYILPKGTASDESIKTMANLVFVMALVQIAAMLIGVSVTTGAAIIMAVSAVQGVFVYILLQKSKA